MKLQLPIDHNALIHRAKRAVLRQAHAENKSGEPLQGKAKLRVASRELARWLDAVTSWPPGPAGVVGELLDRELFWKPIATAAVQLAYWALKRSGIEFARLISKAGPELDDDEHDEKPDADESGDNGADDS